MRFEASNWSRILPSIDRLSIIQFCITLQSTSSENVVSESRHPTGVGAFVPALTVD
jgi:hypothetical protein